jgi:hypothetical protein
MIFVRLDGLRLERQKEVWVPFCQGYFNIYVLVQVSPSILCRFGFKLSSLLLHFTAASANFPENENWLSPHRHISFPGKN